MQEIQTKIRSVTVYSDRARILRGGSFEAQPGTTHVRMSGLPIQLDEKSVRASLRGPARILSIETKLIRFSHTPQETVANLERKIEEIQDNLVLLEQEMRIEQEKAAHANGLLAQSESLAKGYAKGTLSIEKGKELFAFVDETARSSASLGIKKAREKRTLERELKRLQGDLNSLRGQGARERIDCVLQIDSAQAGPCEIELVYSSPGASWIPLYDIRVHKNLAVHYLAEIRQTGEDWNDVEVTLSTASAQASTIIPEFGTWYLRESIPLPRSMPAPAPGMRGAYLAEEESDEPPEQFLAASAAAMAPAIVSSNEAAVTFKLAGRATIPGNGEARKATIAVQDLAHKLDYVAAPKLTEAIFRRAKFKNDSPLMFLPGDCQLFFGDDYIGQSRIPQTAPSEEREVYLGVENRLRVKRELKQHDVDKKLLGDNRKLRWRYAIDLENLMPEAATILVREQIPVSAHQQIKVKVENVSPSVEIQEQKQLEWELQLAPSQKVELTYDLLVEHPIPLVVEGLP